MTDNELTKLIAEKVMGWEHGAMDDHITRFTVGVGCLLVSHPGTLHVAFAPLLSDNDTFQVVDKMIEKGFYVPIAWTKILHTTAGKRMITDMWHVGLDKDYMAAEQRHSAFDISRRSAICLAALKAVGVEVE